MLPYAFPVFSNNYLSQDEMDKNRFKALRREFGDRSIPELIDLLSSEDLRTRFFAEMCLRDATST